MARTLTNQDSAGPRIIEWRMVSELNKKCEIHDEIIRASPGTTWRQLDDGQLFAVAMLISLVRLHRPPLGFVGPFITGWMKERSGSFAGAMLCLPGSLTLAGLLILTLKREGTQAPAAPGSVRPQT